MSDKASNYHITGERLEARNNPSSPAFEADTDKPHNQM